MAHQTKLSSSHLAITGDTVAAQIELNATDLNVATKTTLTDADGNVDPKQLAKRLGIVQAYIDQHVKLANENGSGCESKWGAAQPKKDHVLLTKTWQCPRNAALTYRVTLFQEIDPASRHMVNVEELDPDPFIKLLNKIGLPTKVDEHPKALPKSKRVR